MGIGSYLLGKQTPLALDGYNERTLAVSRTKDKDILPEDLVVDDDSFLVFGGVIPLKYLFISGVSPVIAMFMS